MTIARYAIQLGISTEELFLRAHKECGGFRYGICPPRELHSLWQRGMCNAPPYVTEFLKRDHEPEPQLVLPF